MIGSRVHLRLFVDGVEIPVSAATTSFAEGQGGKASITIIPIDELQDIKPRALVTLFYLESSANDVGVQSRPNSVGVLSKEQSAGINPTASIDEYKLLFIGEMLGISYLKRPSGRSAVLSCVDFLSYLDAIKMYGANYSHGGIEQIENAFQGARIGKNKSTTATGKDLKTNIVSWISDLKTRDSEGKLKENITIGIHRVLKEIFFSGNYFYAKAFNRLRLNDQFVGLSDDTTSINLFDLKYFKKFYDATLARQGSMVSARQIISLLQSPIMYNMTTIPCPYLDERGESRVYDTEGTPLDSKIIEREAYAGSTLNQFVLKPDSWFFAPPSCNIILPHMYSDFQISRDYSQETTRFILRTDDLIQGTAYTERSWNYFAGRFFSSVKYIKAKRLKDRIYAPDIEEFNDLMERGKDKGFLSNLNDVLMTHEKFTGPVSTFAYAGALGQYVSKKARREYMGFFTDYMFWKYRFQGRSANVTMAFNPNIVPGFPAVILDRPLTPLEKAENKHRKHFIGHVVSVTHSLSTQGVVTQVQLVAVRPYDESIDFDALSRANDDDEKKGEGQSIEQIAMGFDSEEAYFDDRYSPARIGSEYYEKILGCDSIVDSFSTANIENEAVLNRLPGNGEELTVAKAILALSDLYDLAVAENSDLSLLSSSLTWRPKATMTQILGTAAFATTSGFEESKNYPQLTKNSAASSEQGFMASAIDPDSADTKATYTESVEGTKTVTTQVKTTEEVISGDDFNTQQIDVVTQKTSTVKATVDGGEATYGLDDELRERQARLLAYLEAIKHRGIRG